MFTIGNKKPTNSCPPCESLVKQRSSMVFHTKKGGPQDNTSKLEIKGEGWGVDPRRKADKDAPLTADNLVIELSGQCYVDTARRTNFFSRGCDLEKAAKGNRRCKNVWL